MSATDLPAMTAEELAQRYADLIDDVRADIDVYDERAAIQADACGTTRNDNQTITERAMEALQRPERFRGEHDVAKAWLRSIDPHRRVFWRCDE